jgi:hypothetical protein
MVNSSEKGPSNCWVGGGRQRKRPSASSLPPARLDHIAKLVPAVSGAPVVVASCPNRPIRLLHDECGSILVLGVPRTRLENPTPTSLPFAGTVNFQVVIGNPLGHIKSTAKGSPFLADASGRSHGRDTF